HRNLCLRAGTPGFSCGDGRYRRRSVLARGISRIISLSGRYLLWSSSAQPVGKVQQITRLLASWIPTSGTRRVSRHFLISPPDNLLSAEIYFLCKLTNQLLQEGSRVCQERRNASA